MTAAVFVDQGINNAFRSPTAGAFRATSPSNNDMVPSSANSSTNGDSIDYGENYDLIQREFERRIAAATKNMGSSEEEVREIAKEMATLLIQAQKNNPKSIPRENSDTFAGDDYSTGRRLVDKARAADMMKSGSNRNSNADVSEDDEDGDDTDHPDDISALTMFTNGPEKVKNVGKDIWHPDFWAAAAASGGDIDEDQAQSHTSSVEEPHQDRETKIKIRALVDRIVKISLGSAAADTSENAESGEDDGMGASSSNNWNKRMANMGDIDGVRKADTDAATASEHSAARFSRASSMDERSGELVYGDAGGGVYKSDDEVSDTENNEFAEEKESDDGYGDSSGGDPYGYGNAQPDNTDYGYGDQGSAQQQGYGDVAPQQTDYGYGDSAPQTDYGYGDSAPQTDYGYGDSAPQTDYGYGDSAPQTDYGYGDSEPAQEPKPKGRPRRRCSVTKYILEEAQQAQEKEAAAAAEKEAAERAEKEAAERAEAERLHQEKQAEDELKRQIEEQAAAAVQNSRPPRHPAMDAFEQNIVDKSSVHSNRSGFGSIVSGTPADMERMSRRASRNSRTSKTTANSATSGRHYSREGGIVSFTTVQVRHYERILTDNPSCGDGPSIGIGWKYVEKPAKDCRDYERSRPRIHRRRKNRPASKLIMPRPVREQIVRQWGFGEKEIANMVREKNKARYKRQQTANNLGAEKLEETMESATKNLKKLFSVGRSPKGQ